MIEVFSDRVWTDTGITPAVVTLDGPVIAAVEPCARADWSREGLDFGAQLVTPALVNAHTHLSMSALRGLGAADLANNVVEDVFFTIEAALQPGDIRAFTRMGAYECLLTGTGTVWDHYYGGEEVAEALLDVGLCGVVAPTLQDRDGPGAAMWEAQLASTLTIDTSTRFQHAGIAAALGPHATDTVSASLWDRIADIAERHALPIHVHIAQSIEEVERSWTQDGREPVDALADGGWLASTPHALLVHALFVGAAALDRLDPSTHTLGFCPASQVLFNFPARISAWRSRGHQVAIGTDAGACNDTMNVQQELRWVPGGASFATTHAPSLDALLEKGDLGTARSVAHQRSHSFAQQELDPEVLLKMALFDGHPRLPVGRLAAGARANLAVWDLSHPALWPGRDPLRALAFGDATKALSTLIVNGSVIGEVGNVSSLMNTPEYREAHTEASERLAGLLARVRR